jgi:hypothetical protein
MPAVCFYSIIVNVLTGCIIYFLSLFRAARLALTAVNIPPMFKYQRKATGTRIIGIATIIAINICEFILPFLLPAGYGNIMLINLRPVFSGQTPGLGFPERSKDTPDVQVPQISRWEKYDRYGYNQCYQYLPVHAYCLLYILTKLSYILRLALVCQAAPRILLPITLSIYTYLLWVFLVSWFLARTSYFVFS